MLVMAHVFVDGLFNLANDVSTTAVSALPFDALLTFDFELLIPNLEEVAHLSTCIPTFVFRSYEICTTRGTARSFYTRHIDSRGSWGA